MNDSGMLTEQQYLLTEQAYHNWIIDEYGVYKSLLLDRYAKDNEIKEAYLKEHNLPLDSEII